MKDVGLRIRLQKELREEFLEACKAQDKPAAQVLREFMRAYVAAKPAGTSAVPGISESAAPPSKRRRNG